MAKIGILSYYSGFIERGVETFVFEISTRLAKKHNVSIFQAGEKITDTNIRTYTIKAFISKPSSSKTFLGKIYLDIESLKILLFTIKCVPKIVKNRYDILMPTNGGWQTVILRIVSKILGVKMIVGGHAGIGSDDAWNIFFRPDVFIALTTPQKIWAKKISPETNVELIPNGVNLSKFNPQVSKKNLTILRPIVVCTSALEPHKNVDLTIRAVAKAKMSLLLLGDGQLRGQLDNLGKRLLKERYIRLSIPYSEIARYYRLGDVFSMVSETEAFGLSYLEAMACNLPVVAKNDKSREEIIGDAGILTNPQDTEHYAKDLIIAANSNYRNIPYNQALKFSWNKISKKYSDLIDTFLK